MSSAVYVVFSSYLLSHSRHISSYLPCVSALCVIHAVSVLKVWHQIAFVNPDFVIAH